MERIFYKLNLDVTKSESQKCLTGFCIGETEARQLRITLSNGKNPMHLSEGDFVSMFVMKPSDTSPSVQACSIEDDMIIYDVLQSDVSEEGVTRCTIKIQHLTEDNETSITYAASFVLQVVDPECDDSHVPDDPEYSVLEALVAEVEVIKEELIDHNEDAEAWANGTRNGTEILPDDPAYHKNAKWWAENAEEVAEEEILKAEAWANGTKHGIPVPDTDPAHNNNSKFYSQQAASSATNAGTSASNASGSAAAAAGSALSASGSASTAGTKALDSEAWANGTRNGEAIPSTDPAYHKDAKYHSDQAASSATNAGTSATNANNSANAASGSATAASGSASTASTKALDAEAWANGTRNGADIPSTDPAYQKHSKYWADRAKTSETNAATSATNAGNSATAASGSEIEAARLAGVAEDAAEDAAEALEQINAALGMVVFTVNFSTGELEYSDDIPYVFQINPTTGNLEWEVSVNG